MSRPPPKTVAIIGAGLAGAACASVFFRRGYSVTIYEQAESVAAGASGVPLALFAPSVSADDAPHSRMLRRGVHLLVDELKRLTQSGELVEGVDWAMTGVRERTIRIAKRLPRQWLEPHDPFHLQSKMLGEREIFHGAAGWVNPKRLVHAWLNERDHNSLIEIKTQTCIDSICNLNADVVVVACGYQTPVLLPELATVLQPIRGQVEWGSKSELFDSQLDDRPLNGMGHWIVSPDKWLVGATFQRDEIDVQPRIRDTDKNFEKLAVLIPEFDKPHMTKLREEAQSWVGVRTAQKNRLPLMVQPNPQQYSNLWTCTGLGSRGLTLAMLCANDLLLTIERSLTLS